MNKFQISVRVCFFTITLLISHLVYAGQKGNGGDAVVCIINGKTTVELLDIYEAKQNRIGNPIGTGSIEDIFSGWLEKLKRLSPQRAEYYQGIFDSAFKYISEEEKAFQGASRFVDDELEDLDDHGSLGLGKGCVVKQVAIQKKGLYHPYIFTFQRQLWEQMDTLNRAALLLHEIIYLEISEQESKYRKVIAPDERVSDSRGVRSLNALIFTSLIDDLSENDFIKFLKFNRLYRLEKDGLVYFKNIEELNVLDKNMDQITLSWPVSKSGSLIIANFYSSYSPQLRNFDFLIKKRNLTKFDGANIYINGDNKFTGSPGFYVEKSSIGCIENCMSRVFTDGIFVQDLKKQKYSPWGLYTEKIYFDHQSRNMLLEKATGWVPTLGQKYSVQIESDEVVVNEEVKFIFGFISSSLYGNLGDKIDRSPTKLPGKYFDGEIRSGWLAINKDTGEPQVFRFFGKVFGIEGTGDAPKWMFPVDQNLVAFSPESINEPLRVFNSYSRYTYDCRDWKKIAYRCKGEFNYGEN